MAHFLKGSDFTVILHGSSACDCGDGTLVPSLLADSKGKQQKCYNSLIGKAGVRLAFYLLDIAGMPGLAQGNLLLPWPLDLQKHAWSMELCLSKGNELPRSRPGLSGSVPSQWDSWRVRRQSDFSACVLLGCVCQSNRSFPTSPNMQRENQVTWKCTWDRYLLSNCSF